MLTLSCGLLVLNKVTVGAVGSKCMLVLRQLLWSLKSQTEIMNSDDV